MIGLPYEEILASLPDALLVVDGGGTIVFANDRAAATFGYSHAGLVGQPIEILIPAQARSAHLDKRASYAREPVRRPMGFGRALSGVRADGTVFPVEVGLGPLAGSALVACMVRDLTEQRHTEETVRIQNVALDAAANAIVITDRTGKIRWVNPAFTRLTGYDPEDVVGRDPSLLKSGQHPPEFYRSLWTTVLAGEPWRGELINRRKDGALYVEEQNIAPVRDKDGSITHFIAIKQDVTERRKIEQALREAKEAAEDAARTKSEFLANTSHELRSPLHAVLGLTELLLHGAPTPEQRGMLETIEQSGGALLALIDDLLDLSRIEAGRFTLDEQPCELRPVLEHTLAQVRPRAEGKGLRLGLSIDERLPQAVRTDGRRLHQVLLNLLGNAAKFTDEGAVTLTVTVLDASESSSRVAFDVRDTGPGIREEQRHQLFKSFSQLDSSSTRRHGGSGLGLAISQALVERMGGAIQVESEGVPGRGSRFFFTLELAAAAAPSRRGSVDLGLEPLPALTVLVAEDSPANQKVIAAQLAQLGARFEIFGDGGAALSAIAAAPARTYDVALLDVNMPVLDGLEVVHAVRRLPADKAALPVIALTASAMRGDRERLLAEGMDEYVSKPVRIPELAAAIRKVLGLSAAPASSATPPVRTSSLPPVRTSSLPPEGQPEPLLFALDELRADLGGDEAALRDVVQTFITSARSLIARADRALQSGDQEQARRALHTLKGSAGSCGSPRLAQLAAALEREVVAGRLTEAGQRMSLVTAALDQFATVVPLTS